MLALLPTDGADPLVSLGDAAEPAARRDEAVVEVDAFSLNRGELFLHEDSDVPIAADLATLVRLVAGGRLQPEIGVAADWRRSAAALADLRERRIRGNAMPIQEERHD
jgi:hypothetical protein